MAATHFSNVPPALPPQLSRNARAILRPRREPGRLPAAVLAVVFHAAFFALIVFGVTWQVKVAAPVNAELWNALPPMKNVEQTPAPVEEPEPKGAEKPLPEPIKPPKVEDPPAPPQPSKTDIALKEKKLKEEKKLREEKLRAEKVAAQKRLDDDKAKKAKAATKAEADRLAKAQREQQVVEERARADAEARDAAVRSARNAAVNDYGQKISKLISDRARPPETVTGKPVVQIRVRLLTNGTVFDAQVIKSSGNRVYDESIERAINGIRQWPLPSDPTIFGARRELILNIEHER